MKKMRLAMAAKSERSSGMVEHLFCAPPPPEATEGNEGLWINGQTWTSGKKCLRSPIEPLPENIFPRASAPQREQRKLPRVSATRSIPTALADNKKVKNDPIVS